MDWGTFYDLHFVPVVIIAMSPFFKFFYLPAHKIPFECLIEQKSPNGPDNSINLQISSCNTHHTIRPLSQKASVSKNLFPLQNRFPYQHPSLRCADVQRIRLFVLHADM